MNSTNVHISSEILTNFQLDIVHWHWSQYKNFLLSTCHSQKHCLKLNISTYSLVRILHQHRWNASTFWVFYPNLDASSLTTLFQLHCNRLQKAISFQFHQAPRRQRVCQQHKDNQHHGMQLANPRCPSQRHRLSPIHRCVKLQLFPRMVQKTRAGAYLERKYLKWLGHCGKVHWWKVNFLNFFFIHSSQGKHNEIMSRNLTEIRPKVSGYLHTYSNH